MVYKYKKKIMMNSAVNESLGLLLISNYFESCQWLYCIIYQFSYSLASVETFQVQNLVGLGPFCPLFSRRWWFFRDVADVWLLNGLVVCAHTTNKIDMSSSLAIFIGFMWWQSSPGRCTLKLLPISFHNSWCGVVYCISRMCSYIVMHDGFFLLVYFTTLSL